MSQLHTFTVSDDNSLSPKDFQSRTRRPRRPKERRLNLWLPDDIHAALQERAKEQHRSMQGQVLRLIETDVRRTKTKEIP